MTAPTTIMLAPGAGARTVLRMTMTRREQYQAAKARLEAITADVASELDGIVAETYRELGSERAVAKQLGITHSTVQRHRERIRSRN